MYLCKLVEMGLFVSTLVVTTRTEVHMHVFTEYEKAIWRPITVHPTSMNNR